MSSDVYRDQNSTDEGCQLEVVLHHGQNLLPLLTEVMPDKEKCAHPHDGSRVGKQRERTVFELRCSGHNRGEVSHARDEISDHERPVADAVEPIVDYADAIVC